LDVGRLSLIYFRIALINLKDLNLNKHIERLRKKLLFALQLTDLTKCPLYVVYASRSYNNEQSPS